MIDKRKIVCSENVESIFILLEIRNGFFCIIDDFLCFFGRKLDGFYWKTDSYKLEKYKDIDKALSQAALCFDNEASELKKQCTLYFKKQAIKSILSKKLSKI